MSDQSAPLIVGVIFPIATFLNFQAVSVPGWLKYGTDLYILQRPNDVEFIQPLYVIITSYLSLTFGIIASLSLFVRMLEKKIKITTLVFMFCSFGQGLVSLVLVVSFLAINHLKQKDYFFTEALVYTSISSLLSLIAASIQLYQFKKHQTQVYQYIESNLTIVQRQLVLLTISSLSYILLMAFVYCFIENWDFDDSLYWTVSTIFTIGFGDVYPKTILGKSLTPIFATIGIIIIGSQIFATRNVVLEVVTLHLAHQFQKSIDVDQTDNSLEYSTPHFEIQPQESSNRHSVYEALDLANNRFDEDTGYLSIPASPLFLPDSYFSKQSPDNRTVTISRGATLPQLRIIAPKKSTRSFQRQLVVQVTTFTFRIQIIYAALVVLLNLVIFGCIFAYLEGWHWLEGIYFTYCTLTTIGIYI